MSNRKYTGIIVYRKKYCMIRLPKMPYFVENINCISFAIFSVFPTFPQNRLSISELERYLEHFEDRNFIERWVRGRYSST